MGWFSIWLARIIGLAVGKKNAITKVEIEATREKIIANRRLYSIKSVVRNNFDLKPAILKLFFWTYWIDGAFLALSVTANIFYTSIFLGLFFNFKISDQDSDNDFILPWIGILIINLLVIFFLIRWISDYYKLSLRGRCRNGYLKLIWLDILTLNFLNLIASLIFLKNKKQISSFNIDNLKINANNLDSQTIKDFSKIITKIEIFILLLNLILFVLAILICYFVAINGIKLLCLFIIVWTIALIQGWSFQKIVGLIIVRKMLKNLLNDNNNYLLLTIIRFLGFNFGGYYMAVFINILNFDESTKEFILENW